jgi:hypothetical protein
MQDSLSPKLVQFEYSASRYASDIPRGWTARLQARLRQSSVPQWRARVEQWQESGLGNLGVSISTKAIMLHRIVGRVDQSLASLRSEVCANESRIRSLAASGRAYRIEKDFVDIDILVDMDAFIFEAHSFLELLIDFMRIFYNNFLFEQFPVRTVRNLPNMFASGDADGAWVATLDKARNIFIHDEAPWLALALGDDDIEHWELVVLRGKTTENPSGEERFDFEEFRAIYQGMTASVSEIIERLAEKLSAAEERLTERG